MHNIEKHHKECFNIAHVSVMSGTEGEHSQPEASDWPGSHSSPLIGFF